MPIKIGFKVEGADRVLRDLANAPPKAKKAAARAVRGASFALERRIKSEMPVDSGRARASWGHWTPGDMVKPDPASSKSDAHYVEHDGGLTIEQGSNVEYIEALNSGHSRQAPIGFIDKAVEVAQRALIDAIARIVDEVFS